MDNVEIENIENNDLAVMNFEEDVLQAEAEDELAPLGEGPGQDFLMTQIACLKAKAKNPEMFVSGYDVDDQGIVEAADSNSPGERLLKASEDGKLEVVKELISAYPEILKYKDGDGYTAIHRAAYSEHPEIIRLLVSKGGVELVEKITEDGWTPLHCACHWNSHKCARELVNCGVNVNAQTNGGQTPLHVASHEQARECMVILLTCPGIDVNIKNSIGETSLDIAKRNGRHAHLFELAKESLINKL